VEPLRLRLLGRPEVSRGGRPLEFRSRKELALLFYLATEGGLHPRERLATLFWADSGEERSRAALRNALYGLRRALKEGGEEGASYLLRSGRDAAVGLDLASGAELDLRLLKTVSDATRLPVVSPGSESRSVLEELRTAAAVYRGEFLEAFSLDDAPDFEHWAGLEREGWRLRAEAVFDRLSGLELEAGEVEAAVATAERWTHHAPFSEAAHLRLIEAYFAAGDGAAALRAFETCQRALGEELGVELSPETEALAARIRAEAFPRSNPQRARSRPSGRSEPLREVLEVPFVGRLEEFGILVAEYHSARGGGARAVAIAGEAGIGKTRLVEQFLRWALTEGADVLKGAAFEATEGLPYGPLVGALRERVDRERAPDDLLDDVWLSELSRLLPELEERYPDLPPPTSDEAAAKARLFEAVAALVTALAERKPVVLFLDDLQWADAATLDLLRYASRRWAEEGTPVLLVMAARVETPETRVRLIGRREGFSHDLPMRRVVLGPLTGEDTLQLLRTLTSPERGDEKEETARLKRFGGWLHDETGGQPFFLSETLSALVKRGVLVRHREAGGWTVDVGAAPSGMVPPGVREAILARLARLGTNASMLLAAAAVLGRPSGFEDLCRVAGMEEDEGLSALEEAVASGLLREVAGDAAPLPVGDIPDAYACAHDKIRNIIYTEAGGARRRVYHRRALKTLEEDEGASASELARHALAAGLSDEAFRHLLSAGDEAMALLAASDAVEHFESARKLSRGARRRGESPPAAEIQRLHVNLGRAYELSGEWEKARETYDAMLAASRKEREPALECAALNRLAILLVQRFGDVAAATDLLEEALEVAETSSAKAAVAETEWNLAQMAIHGWEPDAAVAHAEKALELARQFGLEELAARSLDTLGISHNFAGRWDECVVRTREAAALYARMGDQGVGSLAAQYLLVGSPPSGALHNRAMEAQCLATVAVAEVNRGEPGAGVNAARAALKIGREINNEWTQALAATNLSQGLIETGSYGEALRTAQEGVRMARKLPDPVLPLIALYAAGNARQAIMGLEEAQTMYQEALEIAGTLPRPWSHLMISRLCANRALAGDWEAAHRYALDSVGLREAAPARLMWLDFARYHETEALLRGGSEELAREDVKRLGERVGGNRRFRLVHLRMLAVLAVWDGQTGEALARLREAGTLAEEIGLPGELWQIWAALRELHEQRQEPEEAHGAFSRAARILERLAGEIEDEALKEGFLSAPQPRGVLEASDRKM
jgi:DNA-binding SARP family transcriptional activator/tetratricopeptide (TPR) repeat protein